MTSQTKLRRVALQNSATKGSRIKTFMDKCPFHCHTAVLV